MEEKGRRGCNDTTFHRKVTVSVVRALRAQTGSGGSRLCPQKRTSFFKCVEG